MQANTHLVTAGRHPERFGGLVNTPVFRGSTILAGSMAEWERLKRARADDEFGASNYGRYGASTHHALQEAVAALEGGYRSLLYPSGLAAISTALMSLLAAGDHALVPDCAYSPTRAFLQSVLARYGVEVGVYDPALAGGIDALMKPNTRVVFVESPGSDTFEIQDVPAIAAVAHARGAWVVMDNTWGTPLYFKPFRHGVDVSIQAATKYIVGHSDALLGIVTCTREAWPHLRETTSAMGQTTSPDDVYLALRGLRTMGVRLARHADSGLQIASWLEQRPEVEAVFHPGLASHPGHALWKRDFTGCCGLFSIVLRTTSPIAMAAFVDALRHFGIGLSWGGYESLVIPFTPGASHVGRRWPWKGQAIRIHVGLEDVDDLVADLSRGFDALRAAEKASSARRPVATVPG